MSQIVGYARVSTRNQNLDSQLDQLKDVGCNKIFVDQRTGKTERERTGLGRMLEYIREGDIVVVTQFDRLSRSLMDLLNLVERIGKLGVQVRSLKENFDTSTSDGQLIFHMFGVLAEFERQRIRERTLEGLKSARTQGRIGGRPRSLSEKQEALVLRMRNDGDTMREIARTFNVSPGTISRTLSKLNPGKLETQ